jgi:hypothetical protein
MGTIPLRHTTYMREGLHGDSRMAEGTLASSLLSQCGGQSRSGRRFEEASDSILVGLQLLADSLQLLQDDIVIHLQNLSA